MKILSLLRDAAWIGGVEDFHAELAQHCQENGIEFRALNTKPVLRQRGPVPAWSDDRILSRFVAGPVLDLWLRRYLRASSPDLILIHQTLAAHFLMEHGPRDIGAPVVSVAHADWPRDEDWKELLRWDDRLAGYITVTPSGRQRLIEGFGIAPERVRFVPQGMGRVLEEDRSDPPTAPGPLRILYAGRFERRKASDLIPGFVGLLSESPLVGTHEVELHIAGAGRDVDLVKSEVDDLDPSFAVHWHGWLDQTRLEALLRKSHYFISFSRWEGRPRLLSQAMAAGVVPLVSKNAGHLGMVDHEVTGRTLFLYDLRAYIDALQEISREDVWLQMSAAARKWALGQPTVREISQRTIAAASEIAGLDKA